MTTCPRCDAQWSGLTLCHCSTCHLTFTSLRAFDMHRRGPVDHRWCDVSVTRDDGQRMLRRTGAGHYTQTDSLGRMNPHTSDGKR